MESISVAIVSQPSSSTDTGEGCRSEKGTVQIDLCSDV